VSLCSGLYGTKFRAQDRREHDQDEQPEGKAGYRVLADDVAGMLDQRGDAALRARRYGNVAHGWKLLCACPCKGRAANEVSRVGVRPCAH